MAANESAAPTPASVETWLTGGGEAGALVRAFDWSETPLGPVASWPPSLKTTVGMLLHSRHPMFLWWGAELIQIYNDAYTPSFGVGKHPTALGQRGADCWGEIWPIIGPQIEDVMLRARASWNEDQLVCVWRNERLEEVYWTYGYSPVFGEDGQVAGTLVVCTETTGRVLTERRVASTQELTRNVALADSMDEVAAALVGLVDTNPNDTPFFLFCDAEGALLSSAGLTEGECARVHAACAPTLAASAGASPFAVTALPARPPWPEPPSSLFVAPVDVGPASRRGFLVFGLSPRLPFEASYRSHLLRLGQAVGLALARVENYRALKAAAVERDNLLLQAPVPTAIYRGPDHVFELANPLYCRMVNRFDLVGKTNREAFPELVDEPISRVLDHVYETGEPFSSGEMRVPLVRDGHLKPRDAYFTFHLEALRDPRGGVYGMMVVAFEVTDQVEARRGLERVQREREALLNELESANRAKDEFLAMLGHELRNPLSPIVTALHLLKRRAGDGPRRELDIIERQVVHLVRLVDDLLDVSKIARGKITLQKEPLEIAEVLAKAAELASDLFEQRRHRLLVEVPREGLRVEGDPVRLAQVFANVLTNAARYTDADGTVTVRARYDEGQVVVTVTDNGIGISPSMLKGIFEMFVQGQRSTDRREGGLGLGLSLVKSLVSLHGGTVQARSEGIGKGSEFEVSLPATDRPSGESPRKSISPELLVPPLGKRVMIVDDNADAAEMIAEMLASSGHEVRVAHDGPSALTTAESFMPQVAVLDIGLPVMDGYEVARRLREAGGVEPLRLIALTGYGQAHDRARSRDAGFDVHLVKPVDLDRLLMVIAGASGDTD